MVGLRHRGPLREGAPDVDRDHPERGLHARHGSGVGAERVRCHAGPFHRPQGDVATNGNIADFRYRAAVVGARVWAKNSQRSGPRAAHS